MKTFGLLILVILFGFEGIQAQKYIPLSIEHHTHFYGSSEGVTVSVAKGTPWYVFADRANTQVYSASSGGSVVKTVGLGTSFLVIGQEGSRMKVIDSDKVITDAKTGNYQYRAGNNATNVLQGWIDTDKLVLSQRCIKVCDVDIPSAPIGMFNLQGLFISSVAQRGGSFRFYSISPGVVANETNGVPIGLGGFGYIYKIITVGGTEWYLLGQRPEIKMGNNEIVLKGWKPRNQIELWKHRLALEYDWQNAMNRYSANQRLIILRDAHNQSIARANYSSVPFVEKEFNYQEGTRSNNFYFQRALGGGFRNVIIEENPGNLKVGVIKNSSGVDKKIIDPAIAIANDIMTKLLLPKVIFLLDGTQSLESRAGEIYKTIEKTVSEIDRENAEKAIRYQYGTVVYRDKGYGSNIVEKLNNFTSKIADLQQWLITDKHLSVVGKGTDLDYPESVFYGINEAFKHYNGQKSYFNPTFYVLIGDCGNHNRNDETRLSSEIIAKNLQCNISDFVAIQFEHQSKKLTADKTDTGNSWNLFREQFLQMLSIFGKSSTSAIQGGTLTKFENRPGSFLASPANNTSFSAENLQSVIHSALMSYNSTLQEKLVHLVNMLRDPNPACTEASTELNDLVKKYIQDANLSLSVDDIEHVMEWVVIYLANAASSVEVTSGQKVVITDTQFDFFNPGYVAPSYSFLNHDPYKHVIFMTNTDMNKILEFAQRIANLKGATIKTDIQKAWQFMLINSLGLFQDVKQVNSLTISEATSILTGFKGSSKYDNIKIDQIPLANVFTNELMLEYVYEWGITYGYLSSVKNQTWQLLPKNLKAREPVINALLKSKGFTNITVAQYDMLSKRFAKSDSRSISDYYKGYPVKDFDVTYKLKAYWMEADFFSHGSNDFVDQLLSVVRGN